MAVSRTKRTIQNSTTSLTLFLIQVFVGFYSRKIFLDALGDELLGLNTTLGNILSFGSKIYNLTFLKADKIITSASNTLVDNPFGNDRKYLIDLYFF